MPPATPAPIKSALLAIELDGTLRGDPQAAQRLLRALVPHRDRMGVVYSTRLSWEGMWPLVLEGGLPLPDAVIAEMGASTHFPDEWKTDVGWKLHLDPGWDLGAIRAAAGEVPGLALAAPSHQGPYMSSYVITPGTEPEAALAALLDLRGLEHRLAHTGAGELVVLPAGAGKGKALEYVARRFGVPYTRVLACGSTSDAADLLMHEGLAALVGGAPLSELTVPVFMAHERHGAGILEALEHFNWLEKRPVR